MSGNDPPKDSRLKNKERKEGGHKRSKCRVVDWHPGAMKSTGANAALDDKPPHRVEVFFYKLILKRRDLQYRIVRGIVN
jgi:hypothetical protein